MISHWYLSFFQVLKIYMRWCITIAWNCPSLTENDCYDLKTWVMLTSHSRKKWWHHQHFVSMSLSCLCMLTPKNSNFPNFNWINPKFGLGVHFRALISRFTYIYGGVDILTRSVFDYPLLSTGFIILFENLGAGR